MAKTMQSKRLIIGLLYLGALMIIFLGIYFSTYSVLNKITFKVLNADMPGFVFGFLTTYLGLRYFFMVQDFKTGFYESTGRFSWTNFKRKKNSIKTVKGR